jgi:pyrroline-5-carboxylate reductase
VEGRIGLLGVGHLSAYLVPGLLRGIAAERLRLSPRNAETSAALAGRYGLTVAPDNAALIEDCDVVLLATRSPQAVEAVAGLPWRAGQTLVSVCAGVQLADLPPAAAPAAVDRAMPITSASIGESPTSLYPDLPAARAVLAPLGPILAMPDEAAFEAASVSGAVYAWTHALVGDMAAWAAEAGVPADLARDLMAQTFRAAAGMVRAHPERPVEAMIRELATPGGLTQAGLDILREERAFEAWRAACEAAFAKVR